MNIAVLFFINLLVVFLLMLSTPPIRYNSISNGKSLFDHYCAQCHGKDGTKRKYGASNLQKSKLSNIDYLKVIMNGRGKMPAWGNKLSSKQIKEIIDYLQILKSHN